MDDDILGYEVQDVVSGIKGIVVALNEYLNGCKRVGIQPRAKDGDTAAPDYEWVDIQQIEVIGAGARHLVAGSNERRSTGGDRPDAPRM